MKADIFQIPNFAGGLNTKVSDIEIADNECVDIQNFEFDPIGALKIRGGTSKYNSSAIAGVSKIYHLDKLYPPALTVTPKFFAWGYTEDLTLPYIKMYRDASGTFSEVTINDLGTGATANKLSVNYIFSTVIGYGYVNAGNLIFTNGSDLPYRIGSGASDNAKRLGIIAPTLLTVIDSGGGGAVADGWYRWRVTWKNLHDSIESAPFTSLSYKAIGGTSTMTLTIPACADSNVSKMRIYRTHVNTSYVLADADESFYLVDEVDDATTYADIKADTDLIVAYDINVDDHQPPPTKPRYCLAFQNRLWLIHDNNIGVINRLYFSMIGQPDYFPTNNFIDIGSSKLGLPRGLFNLNNELWVAFENGFVHVNATGVTSSWSVDDPISGIGVYSDRSLQVCSSMPVPVGDDGAGKIIYGSRAVAIYLAQSGQVWAFDGSRFFFIGEKVQDQFTDAPRETLLHAPAIYYFQKHQYKISLDAIPLGLPYDIPVVPPNTSDFKDRTNVFDILLKAWTRENRIFESAVVWTGSGDEGELYIGSVNSGYIYRQDVGGQDDGVNIEAYWRSKQFSITNKEINKRFRKQYLDAWGAATTSLNLTILIDRGEHSFNTEVTLGYGGTITTWDNNVWENLSAPTFSARIDGSLDPSANYKFAYIFYNPTTFEVTSLSDTSATMTTGADPEDGLQITIPADADSFNAGFTKFAVARTIGGGSALGWESLLQNRVTGDAFTYDSTIPDSSIIEEADAQATELVWSDTQSLDFAEFLSKLMVGKLVQFYLQTITEDSELKINKWALAYKQKTIH